MLSFLESFFGWFVSDMIWNDELCKFFPKKQEREEEKF
jgi:hypothetical protein